MKINTDLAGFYGYYGSIFDDVNTSHEFEYINEQRTENGLKELENDNDINWDYNSYYSELNKQLTNCVEEFLTDLKIVKSIQFVKLHSPKEYNFVNDRIECIADVNVKNCKKYINDNLTEFEKYLIDNFKTRDGFSSFYEYDLNFWLNKMKSFKNLDHIEIHAILNFICENENFDIVDHLYNVGIRDIPSLSVANFEDITTYKNYPYKVNKIWAIDYIENGIKNTVYSNKKYDLTNSNTNPFIK